jgi:hypothetical protein
MLGVVGATTGGLLFTAAAAQAVTGSGPGQLALNPTSGATTLTPTWSTTTACPSGFQTSAVLFALNTDGSIGSSISPTVAAPTAPFSGTLLGNIGSLISLGTNVTAGGTSQFVVGCFAGVGGTGNVTYVQSIFVSLDATGANYTTSATGPAQPVSTTTSVVASPNPAQVGTTVTLTATETAADGTHPAGSVQFSSGGTNIGTAVAVGASGMATTTTTFAAAGSVSVSAAFTPTNTAGFSGSTGTTTVTVTTTAPNTATVPITVTVPPSGVFTFTVAPGTVNLAVSGTPAQGTGVLNAVTVSDSRNTFPGWSVSGQESDFAGSGTAAGSTISGNQLGWTPTGTPAGGATLGPVVAPGSPGLGATAGILAQAHAGSGSGTSNLSANLLLDIPASAAAGPYAGTLTLTAVTSLP